MKAAAILPPAIIVNTGEGFLVGRYPPRMLLKLHFRETCHVIHFDILCLEVLSLLAVDLFTILLIFVIATQSNQMPMGDSFEFCIQSLFVV